MEITGRVVANATTKQVKGDRTVTDFRVAINHTYVTGGEKREETTYVDCSYWRNEKLALYLTKGLLVQIYGHMSASAWVNKEGNAQANLSFHANEITLLSKSDKAN